MNAVQPSKGYAEAWLLQSRTDPTQSYIVSKRSDGTFACACPAWKFAKAPKPDCKHIDAVRESLEGTRPTRVISTVEELNEIQGRATRRIETIRTAAVAPTGWIHVQFDGEDIGFISPEAAERFKANMREAAKPPQPEVTQFGDFTIRRKFRL